MLSKLELEEIKDLGMKLPTLQQDSLWREHLKKFKADPDVSPNHFYAEAKREIDGSTNINITNVEIDDFLDGDKIVDIIKVRQDCFRRFDIPRKTIREEKRRRKEEEQRVDLPKTEEPSEFFGFLGNISGTGWLVILFVGFIFIGPVMCSSGNRPSYSEPAPPNKYQTPAARQEMEGFLRSQNQPTDSRSVQQALDLNEAIERRKNTE